MNAETAFRFPVGADCIRPVCIFSITTDIQNLTDEQLRELIARLCSYLSDKYQVNTLTE